MKRMFPHLVDRYLFAKYIAFLSFFLLFCCEIIAQSYIQERRREANDCELPFNVRCESLNWLSEFHRIVSSKDSSLFYAQLYYEEASSGSDNFHKVSALLRLGEVLRAIQEPKEALTKYHLAKNQNRLEPSDDREFEILHGIGKCWSMLGNTDSARTYHMMALKLSEELDQAYYRIVGYNSLATNSFNYMPKEDSLNFLDIAHRALAIDPGGDDMALLMLVRVALRVTRYYYFRHRDALIELYALRALNYLEQVKHIRYGYVRIDNYQALAFHFEMLGLDEYAKKCYKRVVEFTPEYAEYEYKAGALYDLGRMYGNDSPTALKLYNWSRALSDSIGDRRHYVLALNNIGTLYRAEGNQEKALALYNEADSIIRQCLEDGCIQVGGRGVRTFRSPAYNAALIYLNLEKYELARANFFWAWYAARRWGKPLDRAIALSKIAFFYEKLGNLDSASYYYMLQTEAIDSMPSIQKQMGMVLALHENQAFFQLRNNNPEYVLKIYYPVFLKFGERGKRYDKIGLRGASIMHKTFKLLNRHRESLEMLELYHDIQDSLMREENQVATLRFDLKQKTLQDSLANVQQQAATKLEYQQQLSQRNYLLFGGLSLSLLAILYIRNRQKLRRQQIEAEAHRLAELDAVKSRLYTNITHEFRTPLTVIQGMNEKVAEQPERFLGSGVRLIRRNTRRLLYLVNQLLDLSKLESGHLQLHSQPVDIGPFLAYLVESFQSYAETQQIELQYLSALEDLIVELDPDRLTDITSNLISNAIKFTPVGGQIQVETLREGSQLLLRVTDTGQGIAEEELPYVFDRFYQADSSDTRVGEGTGVGLALTQELVLLMGGKIAVDSQLGKGSVFTVLLPLNLMRDATAVTALTSQLPLIEPAEIIESHLITEEDAPHILIVEDNADVAQYLHSCLEGDYQVTWARDGQQGIDQTLDLVPDLVISDVMMPRKDGFELCYALKHDSRTSHIPVILLTAKADTDSKLTGLRQGADAYLTKPFDETELRLRIENLLAFRRNLQAYFRGDELKDHLPIELEQEDAFITQFRHVVLTNLDAPKLDVKTMIKALNMSRTPLHNKIKALTGMSTTAFIRHIKLQKASELLLAHEYNVSEVAYATGFPSLNYFSKKFKELYGLSPSEWRQRK